MTRPSAWLRAALSLVFADECAGCGGRLDGLTGPACSACVSALERGAGPRCPCCSLPAPAEGPAAGSCPACLDRPARPPVAAPRAHEGVARKLVLALKYRRRAETAELLARVTLTDELVAGLLRRADVLVPIPAHPLRRRERGFDQAELLARELAALTRRLGGRARPALLLRRRSGRAPQSSRRAADRRRGLARTLRAAFFARSRVRGRRVVLVDDVVTTGTTVRAAGRLLRRLGASDVAVVAVTRAGRPERPRGSR